MIPFSEVIEIVTGNVRTLRRMAAEQEQFACLAREDGDVTYAVWAEAKAAQYRQKARELEAKIP